MLAWMVLLRLMRVMVRGNEKLDVDVDVEGIDS